MLRRHLWMLMLCCGLQPAFADVLLMTNGDRLTGTVHSIADGTVVFDSAHAGRVIVRVEAISQLETKAAAAIRLASGDTLNGRLVIVDEAQALQVEERVEEIALADIERMAKHRNRRHDLDRSWRNAVDLNGSVASGNTVSETLKATAESTLRQRDREHVVRLVAHYQETSGAATRNQGHVGYDQRWFFREDWFLVASGEYFQDRIRGVNERVSLGGGLGHRFWEDSLGVLSVELSLGATYESLRFDTETSPALRWATDYQRLLRAGQLELFHRNRVLQIFETDRGIVFSSTTGLRLALNHRWKANLQFDVQHETRPQEDRKKTDLTYTLGVGFHF
jgi:putative salt-induced outer membrane protein YdiY